MDNISNNTISASEYESLQAKEMTDEELLSMFLSRFNFAYQTEGIYKPTSESAYCKSKSYSGYTINYSFPVDSSSPVASFWTHYSRDTEKPFRIFHIDLHKLTLEFVKNVNKRGYNPPPAKDYRTSTNDFIENENTY